MSENISTQLPNPPELQPLPAPRPKSWQFASYLLILAGLALLGWGGWLYYQSWLEATQPPPARILTVSVADLETSTPVPAPTATPTTPKPTASSSRMAAAVPTTRLTRTPAPTAAPATSTPVDDPIADVSPTPVPTLTAPEAEAPAEAALSQELPSAEEASAETVLSLADNPLVVEPTEGQDQLEAQPASVEPVSAVTSPLTRIVAESISLDSPIVPVGWKQTVQNGQPINVWIVADYAAGWHENSMLPGQGGNIVLSGHHNIKGEVFRYIVNLEPGAIISLYENDQRYDYTVVDKFIVKDKGEPEAVRRENAKWIEPFNDERLTLVTCWPYSNNTHRVIVIAKPATGDAPAGAGAELSVQPAN